MDFCKIREKSIKRGTIDIYPDFVVAPSNDLMIRGKTVYGVWDEDAGLWSTNEYDVARLLDKELMAYYEKKAANTDDKIFVKTMTDFSNGSWDTFKKYVSKIADSYHTLDDKITFSNTVVGKKDYISRRLPYALEEGDISAYEELISTLYEPEERAKLEWAIGSIISGDAKKIQKFIVLYGDAGSGKSTILNIIQKMFHGYYTTFDAKELASTNNAFATDAFSNNPLVAIQHDGDLSDIRDNSKLNSIVSHEEIIINEKFKSRYSTKSNCFLFMATNKPVKITDAKSGLIRRLIDVHPSGRKLEINKYNNLMTQIDFELGAIAQHCLDIYREMGKSYYNAYKPLDMMYKTDPFFNFVEDHYLLFRDEDCTTLKAAYGLYKEYCKESGNDIVMQMYKFREELKNYFRTFYDTHVDENGTRVRSYYEGFLHEKFERSEEEQPSLQIIKTKDILELKETKSLLDEFCKDLPAQYGKEDETPQYKWENVKTKLRDIDTKKLHYILLPENHIIIDFDLRNKDGEKDAALNLEAASKFPKTYAEFSKSGAGVHLHYIYNGDVSQLSRVYSDGIEIKVYSGNSALRRKLTYCNDIPVATINSGLPLREKGGKMINFEAIKSEKGLRKLILRNLNKEIHPSTKSSIDFIYKILEDSYTNGFKYDISDMQPAVIAFACNSTNQSEYCMKLVSKMHFKSDEPSSSGKYTCDDIVFYDVEVFPNLFLINFKKIGKENRVVRMINPTSRDVEELMKFKLVGFNCRRYDNHILYARLLGYSNEELFRLSQKIVNDKSGNNVLFGEAYNISYTDIYDYSSKKQSLKKWEIELGIHHQELGLPWDLPVPEEQWVKVAEYCDNDVIATEAVWNATQGDFTARQILAELAGGTVNDTTNSLTAKLIFGKNRTPQDEFEYRNLAEPVFELRPSKKEFLHRYFPEMMEQKHGKAQSLLPYFEEYKREGSKSYYKDFDVGEGGFVWSKRGIYRNVKTFDVASMHPHSVMAEYLFGNYTEIFHDLVQARIFIKHKDFDKVSELFDGKLTKYCTDKSQAKALAGALKIAINSVYGLTAAKFSNPFKDMRNTDNIVAKRGALFMIDLKDIVEKAGGEVIHIKTDSIKIANPTPEIEELVVNTGKRYGYSFEVEHIFEKICLVNDAVYIAKLAKDDPENPDKWTATGTQFAVPYVFKTLFSHEPIEFEDMCETKSVTSALYLDLNETLPDVSEYEKAFEKAERDYKNGKLSDISFENTCKDLQKEIDKGHDYHFVGKVGLFCPIKPGCGGGYLVRDNHGKFASATGAKDFRWLEAETVRDSGKENDIDKSYYTQLVDDAVAAINEAAAISKFGDINTFVD